MSFSLGTPRSPRVYMKFLSPSSGHRATVTDPLACLTSAYKGWQTQEGPLQGDYEVPRWQRTGRNGSCHVPPLWTKVALHMWSNRDDDRAKKVNAISQSCGSSTLVKRHSLMNMHISHQGTGYVEERDQIDSMEDNSADERDCLYWCPACGKCSSTQIQTCAPSWRTGGCFQRSQYSHASTRHEHRTAWFMESHAVLRHENGRKMNWTNTDGYSTAFSRPTLWNVSHEARRPCQR